MAIIIELNRIRFIAAGDDNTSFLIYFGRDKQQDAYFFLIKYALANHF